jgi:hypothetical protein
MLVDNTVLQSIQLSDVEIELTTYRESILPRLQMNVCSFAVGGSFLSVKLYNRVLVIVQQLRWTML